MKWLASLALTLSLLAPVGGADDKPAAPEKKESETAKSSFYPLKEGNVWNYKIGDNRMSYKVTGFETINGVSCARIEMTVGDTFIASENIAERPDGLYRYRFADKEAKPPILFLKLPAKSGQTWKVNSEIGGKKLMGTFKSGEETVEVPFGKFKCVTVTSQDMESGGMKLHFTYYFAENVGMVKQVVEVSGQKVITELLSFVPAKPKKKEG